MSNNGIRYTDDFKQQIVSLYNSGQSALELSREYGVTTVTIYKWIKQHSPIKKLAIRKSRQRSIKQCKNALLSLKWRMKY